MSPYNMPGVTSGQAGASTTVLVWSLGHQATEKDMLEDKGFGHILEVKNLIPSLNQTIEMAMNSVLECSIIFTQME
jgi:hypothetical protein